MKFNHPGHCVLLRGRNPADKPGLAAVLRIAFVAFFFQELKKLSNLVRMINQSVKSNRFGSMAPTRLEFRFVLPGVANNISAPPPLPQRGMRTESDSSRENIWEDADFEPTESDLYKSNLPPGNIAKGGKIESFHATVGFRDDRINWAW